MVEQDDRQRLTKKSKKNIEKSRQMYTKTASVREISQGVELYKCLEAKNQNWSRKFGII
jgi:hypothetical protein